MTEWKAIESQKDIDELLEIYRDFHDSCIVSLNYRSGAYVDDKSSMCFGNPGDYELTVNFQSQWFPKELEMRFIGLYQCHITGWQNNYIGVISEAYLSFCANPLPGDPDRFIVWSDNSWFEIDKINDTLRETSDTYIIANALMWRTGEEL